MLRNLTEVELNSLLNEVLTLESRLSEDEKVEYGFSREKLRMKRVEETPDGFYYRNPLPQRALERLGFIENEFPTFTKDREWWQKMDAVFNNEELSEDEKDAQMDALRSVSPFTDPNRIQDYGVADTVEQVVEHCAGLNDLPGHFIVDVAFLRKSDEPEEGGWRWHKWGEYIGTKEPQHEYLAHEGPEFEEIVLFKVAQLKEPQAA